MMMIPCTRSLTCLHRAVGGARWKSSFRQLPLLSADPGRALMDEQISIKGRFLPPQSPITVCAQMYSDDGDLWEAFAHYNTRTDGTVNLTRDHSVGGSYLGCEPMGLFWGLQPAPGGREGLRLKKKNVETPYVTLLSLLEGHVSPSEPQSTELAAVTTERWYMAPGVRRTEIRQDGVVGTLFLPPGPGPFPAMLDLWGMGGGPARYRAALFASRGYASLALAYLGHKDLPGSPNHFGAYLALRLATRGEVKPSCLICINGPAGSVAKLSDAEGRTEEFEIDKKYWRYDDQGYVSFRDVSLPANIPTENKVKIEQLACPLMFIVGEDDLSASSMESANLIEETLRAAGKSQLFTLLSYPGAGHLIEPPYTPNSRESLWSIKPRKLITLWGGHLAPHAAAQEDAWKKILDFMDSNLRQ